MLLVLYITLMDIILRIITESQDGAVHAGMSLSDAAEAPRTNEVRLRVAGGVAPRRRPARARLPGRGLRRQRVVRRRVPGGRVSGDRAARGRPARLQLHGRHGGGEGDVRRVGDGVLRRRGG